MEEMFSLHSYCRWLQIIPQNKGPLQWTLNDQLCTFWEQYCLVKVCAFSFSCKRCIEPQKMNLSQYCMCYNVTDSCYFCTDERNLQTASITLLIPFLKKGHAALIFLLDQFLYQLYMGTWLIRWRAFWEQFQAGVHLKSFSVDDNCVVTPQCSSHSWEGLNPAHNSLYFFGLSRRVIA